MDRRRIVITCVVLFAVSFAVRVLVWQNNKVEMAGVQWVLTELYKDDAHRLVNGDIRTFLSGPNPPSDAVVLEHPPGYPIFIAAVWSVFDENGSFLIVQLLLNSLAPLLVFAIALRLFEYRTALIAGILTAVAPQFAYHSGLMLPDELSVVPILAGIYALTIGRESGKLVHAVVCGVAIGISCWLRSNAMLLPIFFALGSVFFLPKGMRVKFSTALIAAFVLTIAPVTIRNYVYFNAFIPLSVGTGTTFLEGLGDYDADGRLGMPKLDEDVMRMDVARSGRPDYYGFLYAPDGVERERARVRDGLDVVAANPVWYAKAVAHRATTSFRMERVPAIASDRDERETTPATLYFLNKPLKLIQNVFVTGVILPLFLFGILVLIWLKPQRKELLLLAIAPVYYATVQSLLHTEYRYVLATPHVMMIVVAAGLSYLLNKITRRPTGPSEANREYETSHA